MHLAGNAFPICEDFVVCVKLQNSMKAFLFSILQKEINKLMDSFVNQKISI